MEEGAKISPPPPCFFLVACGVHLWLIGWKDVLSAILSVTLSAILCLISGPLFFCQAYLYLTAALLCLPHPALFLFSYIATWVWMLGKSWKSVYARNRIFVLKPQKPLDQTINRHHQQGSLPRGGGGFFLSNWDKFFRMRVVMIQMGMILAHGDAGQ